MKLNIHDIPLAGLSLKATAAMDPWFALVVQESCGEQVQGPVPAEVTLEIFYDDEAVTLSGEIRVQLSCQCDRCLVAYEQELRVPVQQYLVPVPAELEPAGSPEVELTAEDLESGTYDGQRVDVAAVVREPLVLALPLQQLCTEDCRGLCTQCGIRLGDSRCACALADEASPGRPFTVLQGLKI